MSVIHNIIVGIDRWDDITCQFMNSIRAHEATTPIIIIDNYSRYPYPNNFEDITVIRTNRRMGYAEALNVGILYGEADWYVCFNNDCRCNGKYISRIEELDPNILYGSKISQDMNNNHYWVESAWLVISSKIQKKVGLFDENLDAGFEDFDYELRAEKCSFQIAVAPLNITHLAQSTRFDESGYQSRWIACRKYFEAKHKYPTEKWFGER